MRKAVALIAAILLLTIPAYAARSDNYSITTRVDKARDIVVFESNVLTAEISGKRPSIRFYYTGDRLNLTHFKVSLEKIVEYDENLEVVQECDVESWTGIYGNPTPIISGEGSEVGIGVHQALLKYPSIPFLIVFTEFSMYYSNFTETRQVGALSLTTTTLGAVELKTTIRIVDWPFKNPETGRLALVFRIEKEIVGETAEQHHFTLNRGGDQDVLHIVGDDTKVEEGLVRWSNNALMSNATDYYLTPIEAANLNETDHDAKLILVYGRMHTNVARMFEQILTIGVVEENAEFIVHPTPPTITPEIILTAAAVTLAVLAVIVVKARPKKG